MTTVERRPSSGQSRTHRRHPDAGNAADGPDPAEHASPRSSEPISMAEAVKVRAACHAHARDLLNAATKLLDEPATPNLAYHLGLLALEEIGKAGLIGGQAAVGSARDSAWMDTWLSNHSRKLLWALWAPFGKIDPADFTEAKVLAERLHARRLAGLYVDPSAEGPLPREAVLLDEAQSVIDLARSLLRAEPDQPREVEVDARPTAILEWFLRTLDDPEGMRQLFSPPFLAKYEELGGDAARWAEWAKVEFERFAAEADAALRREFARQPGSGEQPKWRHSLSAAAQGPELLERPHRHGEARLQREEGRILARIKAHRRSDLT